MDDAQTYLNYPDQRKCFNKLWLSEKLVDKYQKMDYSYIISYDNADGFLKPARLGFVVKNY